MKLATFRTQRDRPSVSSILFSSILLSDKTILQRYYFFLIHQIITFYFYPLRTQRDRPSVSSLKDFVAYLSLFLILALMLLTDTRFTSRMVAMASSSKWRSSCMMRKIYCAVERPLYLCSHSCQRFGRSWAK